MHMALMAKEWTADDLAELPDDGKRYEIVDGELLVTPAPSVRHQSVLGELYRIIAAFLERERVGHAFVAAVDVAFSKLSVVQPDVLVTPLVNGRWPETFGHGTRLLLAVEVLSPSTARADRVKKRRLYTAQAVDEYWIVDADARTIERTTQADARVDVFADSIQWEPAGAATPLVIDLADFFDKALGDEPLRL